MREHAEVGGKFVTVTNHTTYSFGIDDQEFMPAFECEEPADFMHLMLTLRETEASRWTERDTPIFVGALAPIRSVLAALDGAAVARAAELAACLKTIVCFGDSNTWGYVPGSDGERVRTRRALAGAPGDVRSMVRRRSSPKG